MPYLRALHGSCLNEILVAPWVAKLVSLPRLVHGQEGQVVALCLEKLGALLVCLRLLFPRPVENVLRTQHPCGKIRWTIHCVNNNCKYYGGTCCSCVVATARTNDGQDFLTAAQVYRGDEHLTHGGVQWELCHLAPQPRHQPLVIQRTLRKRVWQVFVGCVHT